MSPDTIKSKIKHKAQQIDEEQWNVYKYTKKDKWSMHYYSWNIRHDKRYGEEILNLTRHENEIRMLLYTNHLPLNQFLSVFMKQENRM